MSTIKKDKTCLYGSNCVRKYYSSSEILVHNTPFKSSEIACYKNLWSNIVNRAIRVQQYE